jgi:hypothetical protein
MPFIIGANSAVGGLLVENSCRFAGSSLTRPKASWGTPTSTKIFTISLWFKISKVDKPDDETIWNCITTTGTTTRLSFVIDGNENLKCENHDGNLGDYTLRFITDRVFRDPGAWYHAVIKVDTTESVEANRFKMYINGVQETDFSTESYPTLNRELMVPDSDHSLYIGAWTGASQFWDGYMSEYCFIDGTALAPTSFGEFNSDSPTIWQPIAVSGLTFGTNGFYLDFEDSSDLGTDASGNGNDLTATSIAATDQATDTPVNNFSTYNPLDNYIQGATFSEGNLQVVTSGSSSAPFSSTFGMTSGKWYWEIEYDAFNGGYIYPIIGISSTQSTAAGEELGSFANDWGYFNNDGTPYLRNNNSDTSWGTAIVVGDIVGVALDCTNNKLYFSRNGAWQESGDPSGGTGGVAITDPASTPKGAYFAAASHWDGTYYGTFKGNFGGCPTFTISSGNADADGYGNFEYAVPTGYFALCTKNLGAYGG